MSYAGLKIFMIIVLKLIDMFLLFWLDLDDELMEPEKPPELIMLSARELPIPDPDYVARTVSPDLHPLIAKTYKKDCRTWLWKSARQREARLAQQRADEENGMTTPATETPVAAPAAGTEISKDMKNLEIA